MKILKLIIFILLISPICFGADWYVKATGGSDSAAGTSLETALATFAHAYTHMSPGDTLYIDAGVYDQQLYPPPSLSGSPGAPTRFIAVNDGMAIIAPADANYAEDSRAAIYVYSNLSGGRTSYIDFEGLFAKATGEHNGIGVYSMDFADPETQMTHHINFRRCGSMGGAVDRNVSSVELMGSTDILFEDGYAFGFGRKALEAYGALRVTVRRTIVRFDWWEGDLYKPNDPRIGMTCYNTIDSKFENILSIDAGPRPIGRTPSMAAFVLSGNDAGGTGIQGSANSGYYGSIGLNNKPGGNMNGFEINGGTGTPVHDLTVQDVVLLDNPGFGLNIQDNVSEITINRLSTIDNGLTGTRQNPNPLYGITNVTVTNSISKDNGGYGYYNITPTNSSATGNTSGSTIEAEYMPTVLYPPTNTPIEGHERGADVLYRYENGTKTTSRLWPWPNEELIKSKICDATYLQEIEDKINGYDGTSIEYNPGLCASGETITNYIWKYLGNDTPNLNELYGDPPAGDTTAPTVSSSVISVSGTTWVVTLSENVTTTGTGWSLSCDSGQTATFSSETNGVMTFTTSATVLSTATCTYSYNPATGDTLDGASNEVAEITDVEVTNNSGATAVGSANSITGSGAGVGGTVGGSGVGNGGFFIGG